MSGLKIGQKSPTTQTEESMTTSASIAKKQEEALLAAQKDAANQQDEVKKQEAADLKQQQADLKQDAADIKAADKVIAEEHKDDLRAAEDIEQAKLATSVNAGDLRTEEQLINTHPSDPRGFKPVTLKRFMDTKGVDIPLDEDGLWVPRNEWEYQELQHFQAKGMVELVY